MRNREDEGLLGLIVGHSDHAASPLEEMPRLEIPAQFPVEDVPELLSLFGQFLGPSIVLLARPVEVGILRDSSTAGQHRLIA